MTAREQLLSELQQPTEWVSGEVGASEREALRLVDRYRAEVINAAADLVERVAFAEDGPATQWNWWDAATIPGSIAALLRRHAAPQPDTTKET